MISDRECQVCDGDNDGDLVPGDQQPHQASLEHVRGEEGEKHNDEGEDKTNVLDTENIKIRISKFSIFSSTHTNMTSSMTLSNRKSSEKVLMRRSMMRKVYWTISMDRYLVRESFITS